MPRTSPPKAASQINPKNRKKAEKTGNTIEG
jgi:hypothetical protein